MTSLEESGSEVAIIGCPRREQGDSRSSQAGARALFFGPFLLEGVRTTDP